MKIEQLCQSMKEYFSQFSIIRILLPLSSVLLYVLGGIRLLNGFVGMDSLLMAVVEILYVASLLLVLSNCRFRDLSIGTGLMALRYAIVLIRSLFNGYLSATSLLYLAVYGLITFLAYKKSLQFN